MNMINETIGRTLLAHNKSRCQSSEMIVPLHTDDINKYLSVV